MDAWIGPAIIAALVSASVSAMGWIVTFRATLRLEQLRRDEKVNDFQVALRAEIANDLIVLEVADRPQFLEEVTARYKADLRYSPIIPNLSRNVVFDAIVKDILVLPDTVISPVIHYARLRQTLDQFIADMHAPNFITLSAERQLTMYGDYLDMQGRLELLAKEALASLDASLNSSDAARPNRASASGADEASAERRASP